MTNSIMNNTVYGLFLQRDYFAYRHQTCFFRKQGGTLRNISVVLLTGVNTTVFNLASNPAPMDHKILFSIEHKWSPL
jgi:hypothetical protein